MYRIFQQAISRRYSTALTLTLLGLLVVGASAGPAYAADSGLTAPSEGGAGSLIGTPPDATSDATTGDGAGSGGTSDDGSVDEWNTDVINSPLRMDGGFLWQALRDLFSFESLHRSTSDD